MTLRIAVDGHVAEGDWVKVTNVDDEGSVEVVFSGELVCGPHDANGEHVAPKRPDGGA